MTLGSASAKVIPANDDISFWIAAAVTIGIAIILLKVFPYRTGVSHRTPLPLWIKIPCIMGVVGMLIMVKGMLKGFTTGFPMAGLILSYEARKSLGTTCQGVPEIMINVMILIILCRLLQGNLGLVPALAIGWVILGLIVFPLAARRVAKRA
jgi:hypothetical protein